METGPLRNRRGQGNGIQVAVDEQETVTSESLKEKLMSGP